MAAAGGEGAGVPGVLRCELGGATLLLSCPDSTQLDVWRVDGGGRRSGKPLRSLAKAGHEISCFVKLEGDVAATGGGDDYGAGGEIVLWNVKSSHEISVLEGHAKRVSALCSLGGGLFASGSFDDTVRIWSAEGGSEKHVLRGHEAKINALCSLGGGLLASGSADKTVRIWSAEGGSEKHVLRGHEQTVEALCSLGGGLLASASADITVRIWSAEDGNERHVLRGHRGSVFALCPLGGGLLASGSSDRTVRIWSAEDGSERHVLRGQGGQKSDVVALCSLGGGLLASASGRTVWIWSAEDGSERHVLRGQEANALCSLGGGMLAGGSRDKAVRIWSTADGTESHVLEGHEGRVYALCSLGGGLLASGSWDSTVRIWSVEDGSERHVLRGHEGRVFALCSLGGGLFASGSFDKTVRIWSAEGGSEKHVLRGHEQTVEALCSLGGGLLASGSQDKTVRIWSTADGSERHVLRGHEDRVYALCSLGGGLLASGSQDKTVWIWSAEDGSERHVLEGHQAYVTALCPLGGGLLASGSYDQTVRIWSVEDGSERHVLRGHERKVSALCSLGGGLLASADYAGVLMISDASSAEVVCKLDDVHSSEIGALALDTEEGALYSASIKIVKIPLPPLRRFGIVTSIDIADLNAGWLDRFMALTKPKIDFAGRAVLALFTAAQIASFSLTDVAVPEMPPELEGVVSVVKDLGFAEFCVSLSFEGVFYSSVVFAVAFFVVMLAQERLETRAFLNPDSKAVTFSWLGVGGLCAAASTVLFVSMTKTLLRGLDCTYLDTEQTAAVAVWSMDALATTATIPGNATLNTTSTSVVLVGLECWTSEHIVAYALPSAVCLAVYGALSFRLLRVGSQLSGVELTPTNLFDFRADSNVPQPYEHPLSSASTTAAIATVVAKVIVVATEVMLGTTLPQAFACAVFVTAAGLLATTALRPPYHGGRGARANRLQLALHVGVAWTAFTTLLATLDADADGNTNSRLLLLLPYGIAPAAALGFFAQPLANWRQRQRGVREREAAPATAEDSANPVWDDA